ncbi:MAG: GNAT family N-acetyltransferase [Elusimicrobiota bacterium]|jgi:phosphinothricin acetyltransferase|nr:GNAT family N-acetyltransferase [Elusimicrobiota bacterium]
MIRPVELSDSNEICEIYNYYVENTAVTFEEKKLSLQETKKRITEISLKYPYFVYKNTEGIAGYCYANYFRSYSAYKYTAELSIYLKKDIVRQGCGTELFTCLLDELKNTKTHIALSVITVPNQASIKLHKNFGFKKVGYLTESGYKLGRFHDVSFWELKF